RRRWPSTRRGSAGPKRAPARSRGRSRRRPLREPRLQPRLRRRPRTGAGRTGDRQVLSRRRLARSETALLARSMVRLRRRSLLAAVAHRLRLDLRLTKAATAAIAETHL